MNHHREQGIAFSHYHEFRPPAAISGYLLCLWTQRTDFAATFRQQVLPDCCVDVLLMNGVPVVVGPWTEAFVADLPPGTNILGARCHPGLASSLLGVPASELLNRTMPLCDVWSSVEADGFVRAAEEATLQAQLRAMQRALLARIAKAAPVDEMTRAAIQWIARRPLGRIDELCRWLGLSRRQVQRRFTAAVGYGPKQFQSVLRFQRLLNEAHRAGARRSLADLATNAGYSDQAHMTRECQRFANRSPASLLHFVSSTLSMSDLFKTDDSCTNYR